MINPFVNALRLVVNNLQTYEEAEMDQMVLDDLQLMVIDNLS